MTSKARPTSHAESARASSLRGYGFVLLVSLWSVAAWTLSTPGDLDRFGTLKGADYVQFHVYGRLALSAPEHLFDVGEWRRQLAELVPADPDVLYVPVYPPTVGLLFAAFAPLPWQAALLAWTAISFVLYAAALWLLLRGCPRVAGDPVAVALFALGWPVFVQLVLHGQISTIFLLVVAVAWWAFRAGRPISAGLLLGLLAVKPSLLPVPLVVMALSGRWRVLGGMLLSAALQVLAVVVVLGWQAWVSYAETALELLRHPEWIEPKLWQAHAVSNALVLLLGRGFAAQAGYAVVLSILVGLTVRAWRGGGAAPGLAWALLVLATLVGSPHLYVYDLVIMAAAFVPVIEWTLDHPDHPRSPLLQRLVAASYLLPLAAPLAAVTRVQLSVLAFGALFWTLSRVEREISRLAAAAPSIADPHTGSAIRVP